MESQMQEVYNRLHQIECALKSPPKEYLGVADAAEFMGMSKVTLDEWRSKGGGPAFHRVGRRIIYSVQDIRDFIATSRVEALR